jgi:hypothetical protein
MTDDAVRGHSGRSGDGPECCVGRIADFPGDEVPLTPQEPRYRRAFVAEVRGFGDSGAHAVLTAAAVTSGI